MKGFLLAIACCLFLLAGTAQAKPGFVCGPDGCRRVESSGSSACQSGSCGPARRGGCRRGRCGRPRLFRLFRGCRGCGCGC